MDRVWEMQRQPATDRAHRHISRVRRQVRTQTQAPTRRSRTWYGPCCSAAAPTAICLATASARSLARSSRLRVRGQAPHTVLRRGACRPRSRGAQRACQGAEPTLYCGQPPNSSACYTCATQSGGSPRTSGRTRAARPGSATPWWRRCAHAAPRGRPRGGSARGTPACATHHAPRTTHHCSRWMRACQPPVNVGAPCAAHRGTKRKPAAVWR